LVGVGNAAAADTWCPSTHATAAFTAAEEALAVSWHFLVIVVPLGQRDMLGTTLETGMFLYHSDQVFNYPLASKV